MQCFFKSGGIALPLAKGFRAGSRFWGRQTLAAFASDAQLLLRYSLAPQHLARVLPSSTPKGPLFFFFFFNFGSRGKTSTLGALGPPLPPFRVRLHSPRGA